MHQYQQQAVDPLHSIIVGPASFQIHINLQNSEQNQNEEEKKKTKKKEIALNYSHMATSDH